MAAVSDYSLPERLAVDPIEKGRFLAELERCRLLVVVGDRPIEFVSREIDDVPVFFLDAGVISGRMLRSGQAAGIFAFNVDAVLDAVAKLWPGQLGLAYTPGYEPFADWVRRGAQARGLTVAERRLTEASEIPRALEALARGSRSIWLAGDPLLVRGAGFEFASELSLSRRIPLLASSAAEVEQGAALAFSADPGGFADPAAQRIGALLRGDLAADSRLAPAPAGGRLLVNAALARRWGFKAPSDGSSRSLR